MLKIRNLSVVVFIIVIIIIIMFSGCSLKQANISESKKSIEAKQPIVTQEDDETRRTHASVNFYGDKNEPIVVYQHIPFEDGTLVLAERVTDGEHYPDLHFIDSKGNITYLTRGSYCWTLNYRLTTQMVDKEINQNDFVSIVTNEKREIVLPKQRGYYLFVLRIKKANEIQTYTGLLKIN